MIATSSEYKTYISKSGRHFETKIVIDGKTYTSLKNLKIYDGTNSQNDITFGDTVSAYFDCIIPNVPKGTVLKGKKATLFIGLKLSNSVEWLQKGIYYIDVAKRNSNFVSITAYDSFYMCSKGYFTELKGNQKLVTILNEVCKKAGIAYGSGADDVNYNVDNLNGLTLREVIGRISAYCAKNAVIDNVGKLQLKWYTNSSVTITPARYAEPLEISEEDIFINRLECTIDEENTLSVGTGVGILFSCPGMTQERLNNLYSRVKGFTYRAAKINWKISQPEIEPGDIIKVISTDGTIYNIPYMQATSGCDGGYFSTIEAKGKSESEQENSFVGPLQKKVEITYTDVISTKKLLTDTIIGNEGKFEIVDTNYLNVGKKITAFEGEFKTINTKIIESEKTITNELTAITGKINVLETVDLKTIKADITQANINIANINTLIGGSITAGSTQTIVLNAQNTTIANALIKSAMIDTLDFNKITGIDINTTKLKVHSNDGLSQWFDNTIQISDKNRVRVQIGKDASNDYNMYVWDSAGKLMFDATGVTANGIQKPIIRDNMVASDANIAGDKLNITSVINKINGNSTLIEASHVKYDGKSLDVAFNSMQTSVSSASSTANTALTNANSANSKIDGLQIGARNLLLNSSMNVNLTGWANTGSNAIVTMDGYKCLKITGAIGVTKYIAQTITNRLSTDLSTHYTLSAWIKCDNYKAGTTNAVDLAFYFSGTTTSNTWMGSTDIKGSRFFSGQNNLGWKYITYTFKFNKEFKDMAYHVYIRDVAGDYYIRDICLVQGDKSIPYIPAPEDFNGQIDVLTETLKTQTTQITASQGKIETLINESSQTKKDVVNVQGGLTTAIGNISTLQTNYSSLSQTVSGLSTKIGSHDSSITTLTSTANSALTNANNANSKIDGLQIGVRNLILNTAPRNLTGWSWWNAQSIKGEYSIVADSSILSGKFMRYTHKGTTSDGIYIYPKTSCVPGKEYTWSCYVRTNKSVQLSIGIQNGGYQNYDVGTGWKKLSKTFIANSNQYTAFQLYSVANKIIWANGDTLDVHSLILVEGNKIPVSWQEAPEDIDTRITTEIKTVTDKQASFDVLLTGITGRVSSTETNITKVTNAFNNLQIGGRNLISGTSTNEIVIGAFPSSSYLEGKRYQSNIILIGKEYTLSFDAKSTVDGDTITCHFYNPNTVWSITTSTGYTGTANDGTANLVISKKWTRYWVTYKQTPDTDTNVKSIIIGRLFSGKGTGTVTIKAPKLEEGNKSSTWTPAIEDTEERITTEIKTVTDKQSSMQLDINSFKTTVSNTYTTKSDFNTSDLLNKALSLTSSGKLLYQDATFINGANSVIGYDNSGKSVVKVERIAKPADCPTTSGYCMRITTNGASNPGHGGFYQVLQSRANAVFVVKYLAKIPVGYTITTASNSMGTGYTDKFLSSTAGTGKWETYVRQITCGATGSFSNGGHVYLNGGTTPTASAPLVWYLGAIYAFDVTDSTNVYSLIEQTNTAITQSANAIKLEVSQKYATTSSLNGLTTRMSSAETKLTATSLVTTISSAISGGTAMTTTKFTMDKLGFHVNGGGIDISNNAGTKVLFADSNGNLVGNNMLFNSGTIGGWAITTTSLRKTAYETFNVKSDDADKIMNYILGKVTLSNDEIKRLDIDGDGQLSAVDYVMTKNIVLGLAKNNITVDMIIDSTKPREVIKVECVDGLMKGSTTKIGCGSITTYSICTRNVVSNGSNGEIYVYAKELSTNGNFKVTGSAMLGNVLNVNADENLIEFYKKNSMDRQGYIGFGNGNYLTVQSQVNPTIKIGHAYGDLIYTYGSYLYFAPSADGNCYSGVSWLRWNTVFSTNGSISTSDRNKKKDFRNFDKRYERLFMDFKPQIYRMKDGTRYHSGFVSQDVEESLAKYGLTANDFGGFCKDVAKVPDANDVTKVHDKYDGKGNLVYDYSLRYEEFIALNTHMIQKNISEIDDLKMEIIRLNAKINMLESRLN